MILTSRKTLIGLCLLVCAKDAVGRQEPALLSKLVRVNSRPSFTSGQRQSKNDSNQRVTTKPLADNNAPKRLRVGANVLVSIANPDVPHTEVVTCADPTTQPSTLLVGSMASIRGRYVTYLYRSGDQGRTWSQVLSTTVASGFSDPTCAFSSNGVAYYGVIAKASTALVPEIPASIWIYASRNSGKTWSGEAAKQVFVDRPFLAVDQFSRSDKSYVYYSGLWISESLTGLDPKKAKPDDPNAETGIAVFVSMDQGRSFTLKARPREGKNGDWVNGTGNSVVTASGEIITLFRVMKDRFSEPHAKRRGGPSTLSVMRTSPGAEWNEPIEPIAVVHGTGFPALTVDASTRGIFRGRIYAVAIDGTSVVLFWSADEGRTWHGPTSVREAAPASDAALEPIVFNPAVSVNRDGVVGVSWAEGAYKKTDPFHISWLYRMAASWDGGVTFSDSVNVSSERQDPDRSRDIAVFGSTRREAERLLGVVYTDLFPETGGHTFGLTADSRGVFHAAWTDNRTGVPQVWTAAVYSTGTVASQTSETKDPNAVVDTIKDLTGQTAVELREMRILPQAKEIVVQVRIRNVSKSKLFAPLRVEVADIRSPLGGVTSFVETNGSRSSATSLDFSDLIPAGGLARGETTKNKNLTFKLNINQDLHIDRTVSSVLNMSFRVFGSLVPQHRSVSDRAAR